MIENPNTADTKKKSNNFQKLGSLLFDFLTSIDASGVKNCFVGITSWDLEVDLSFCLSLCAYRTVSSPNNPEPITLISTGHTLSIESLTSELELEEIRRPQFAQPLYHSV